MNDKFVPSWALKSGDIFGQATQCRDFVINGPPVSKVVRLQNMSDDAAKDRAFVLLLVRLDNP
jgi:hypothetical protein